MEKEIIVLGGKTFKEILKDAKTLDEAQVANQLKRLHIKFLTYITTLDEKITEAETSLLSMAADVSKFDVAAAVKMQYDLSNAVEQKRQAMAMYKTGFGKDLVISVDVDSDGK